MTMCMCAKFSHVQLCVTLWIVALQAPPSKGILQARIWSELPCPPPGDLPHPGINPSLLCLLHSLCYAQSLSGVLLFATPWTAARQAFLSIGIFRQKYCSGLPCSPPRDLPNPEIKPRSPTVQADSLLSEPRWVLYHQHHLGSLLHDCVCACALNSSVMSNSLQPYGHNPPGSSVHRISPGKDTGEGCHFLPQGIFLIQGGNPPILHWQVGS